MIGFVTSLFGKSGTSLIIFVVVVVTIGIAFFNSAGTFFGQLLNPPETARVIDAPAMLNSIRPLGQLVSVSTEWAKADMRVSISSGVLGACSFGADHVVTGAVEAGIDFTKLDASKISYDEATNTYTLTLPAPQLTSCRIEYINQYNGSATLCPGNDWDELRLLANYVALTDLREEAIERGILDRARVEAEILMANFVSALTEGSKVNIQFEEQSELIFPSSCNPETPRGWTTSDGGITWQR